MHEMSLCLSMIDLVSERARAEGATRVLRIKLTIGALGNVEPQALAFCFESAAQGSAVEDAQLDIEVLPGRAFCFDCGETVTVMQRGEECPNCQGNALRIDDGEQMQVTEMEII
ncbi:MAG TPA: hydrogenase maturation nickel metallochaperone HypA [Xanthomonadales bacterium]|nr:hydrogenase maturation nickel metallochaperone HypA [Xanthomonadales bacterium]